MDRRKFVTHAGLAGAAGLLAACGKQPATADCGDAAQNAGQQTFEWKMVTTWPRDFPGLGTGANYLARIIGEMSGGRLTVKVYGGNELVPPFEVFDAVSSGQADLYHSAEYYFLNQHPAFAFFTAVPFGIFGALVAVWLRGMENDVYFQIGLVTLIGLSAKNAILIVEFAELKYREGLSAFDAALEAARLRLRPILMTSLSFILGAMPLVLASGAGANARHSIGTGIIGGMIVATTLALFFVPMFYFLVQSIKERVSSGKQRGPAGAEAP